MGGNTSLARQLRRLHQAQSLPPIVSLFNRSGQRQREARSLAGIGKRCRCRVRPRCRTIPTPTRLGDGRSTDRNALDSPNRSAVHDIRNKSAGTRLPPFFIVRNGLIELHQEEPSRPATRDQGSTPLFDE
jgi:hypothetical protein